MQTSMKVKLLHHTADPIETIFLAFRACYSNLEPDEIWTRVQSDPVEHNHISRSYMLECIDRWMQTGHTSPRTHVNYTFAVSGVSRSLMAQLTRHHSGITFDVASQRYIKFKNGEFPFIVPETIEKSDEKQTYIELMGLIGKCYESMLESGIPAEDARYALPNATATNIVFTVNFEEVLHIADQRLCTRAQWEIRRMWALVRAEIKRATPELAKYIGPKCMEHRLGYCDEPYKDWESCPIGRVRSHKRHVFESVPLIFTPRSLGEKEYEVIEHG